MRDEHDVLTIERNTERAQQLLCSKGDAHTPIQSYSLWNAEQWIEFWPIEDRFLSIDFGDFDTEVLDVGVPDDMQQAKRRVALVLLAALIDAGAEIAYFQCIVDKTYTYMDTAVEVHQAYESGNLPELQLRLNSASPWLLALRNESRLALELAPWLRKEFSVQYRGNADTVVYEHPDNPPMFMWDFE